FFKITTIFLWLVFYIYKKYYYGNRTREKAKGIFIVDFLIKKNNKKIYSMNNRLTLQKFTRFSRIESSLEFLLENNIIKETNVCPKYSNQLKVKIYSQNGLKRVIFRCTKKDAKNFNTYIKTLLK
ncbi:hypothetical protein H311_05131, partial [Anncaliia algerae PRA109]